MSFADEESERYGSDEYTELMREMYQPNRVNEGQACPGCGKTRGTLGRNVCWICGADYEVTRPQSPAMSSEDYGREP